VLPRPPSHVDDLCAFLEQESLLDLAYLTQTVILRMARNRMCTSRRAEAIMSALGATNWFRSYSSSDCLVLGAYPLSFVNEVRGAVGSAIFFSSPPSPEKLEAQIEKFCGDYHEYPGSQEKLGSLLPFGSCTSFTNVKYDVTGDVFDFLIQEYEDASLRSWEIKDTGMVTIRRANIVSTSEEDQSQPSHYTLMAPIGRRQLCKYKHYLHHWIKSYKPKMRNYAVCLSRTADATSSSFGWGILLKEIQPGMLIKVGVWHHTGHIRSVTKEVHWSVW